MEKSIINKIGNLTIDVATNIESVNSVRTIWEAVQSHPNSDIDSYLINVQSLSNVLMPYVMVLRVDEVPKALLIGRIEETRVEYKLGFKVLKGPRLRQLIIVYQGFIGETSESIARCFMDDIQRRLGGGEFDAVFFYALNVDSALFRAADAAGNIFTRDHGMKVGQHWKVLLPAEGIDTFLQNLSSKHRYWLRRLPKVLEKAFPDKVAFRCFTEIDEVEQLVVDCERVASKTYHRAAGVGFRDSDLWRSKFRLWASKGVLRGHVLYIDDQPSAFWLANLYGNTLHLDFTGYLPEYKKFELGTILFLRMVEDAIASGARELDYGLGALWYKERFGGENWAEASLYLFAPSIKGVTANLTRWAFSSLGNLTKGILNKLGATGILMRKWRDRLSSRGAVTEA